MSLKTILNQGLTIVDTGAIGYFKGRNNINDLLWHFQFDITKLPVDKITNEADSIREWAGRMKKYELFSVSGCATELQNYEQRIRNSAGIMEHRLIADRRFRNNRTRSTKIYDSPLEAMSELADAISQAAFIFRKRCIIKAFSPEQRDAFSRYRSWVNSLIAVCVVSDEDKDADVSETDKDIAAAALTSAVEEPTSILTMDNHLIKTVRRVARHRHETPSYIQFPQYPVQVYHFVDDKWQSKADSLYQSH